MKSLKTHPPETAPVTAGRLRGAVYDRALRALRRASPFVTSRVGSILFDRDSKVSEGVRGRRDAARSLVEWGRTQRDPHRPLVWFHAPSVGEGLQARAVMDALLEVGPDVQLVFTFFSPSARGLAGRMPARVAGYLPWDTRDETVPVLEALAPALVVFTKTEVWPGLSAAAAARGIPTALVAATLPADAGRLRWPAPLLLRPAFGRLARVGAISEEDGARFGRLGVEPARVTVTGDPGIDSAAERAAAADFAAPYLAPFIGPASHAAGPARSAGDAANATRPSTVAGERLDDEGSAGDERSAGDVRAAGDERPETTRPAGSTPTRPTLVAGSTWGPDEEVLLPAFVAARRAHPALRMILAPHEPEGGHLRRLEARLQEEGIRSRRLAEVEERGDAEGVDVVVVDRTGVLAHLYRAGTFAFVGGGFHRHGLHSVLEPAAAGLPVLFGPRHSNSRAASDLVQRKGARVVHSPDETAGLLTTWLESPDERERAAGAALAYISGHRGAARRTARMLASMIELP